MGSTKTKTKTNETATTTPTVPDYAIGPIQNYYSDVAAFGNGNMADYTTPANQAQLDAFARANSLYNNGELSNAIGYTTNILSRLGGVAPATGSYATAPRAPSVTDVAGIGDRGVSQAKTGTLGPAALAQAANAGQASSVNLGGYDASGYDPSLVGDLGQFMPNGVERIAGQSLLDNLPAYMNPYLSQVVDTTAADMDTQAGRIRAQQAADMARTGAFGGSRSAILGAQTEGELARARASTLSGLRSDAFNTATGLSNLDADRRQGAGMFNAGAQNTLDLARGQLGAQGALANQGALNTAGQFNAGARNDAAAFGANALNQGQLFNAGSQNDFALQNAGFQQQANLQNAGAQNQYGLAQFDATNSMNQFNAGALNDAAAQQYGIAGQNAQQNAQAANALASQVYGTQADLNQFNAGQANDLSQFNANLDLNRYAQQLAAANQAGQLALGQGADNRANIETQMSLGDRLWELQNQNSPLNQLLIQAGLLDPGVLDTLTGQTINSQGTSTSKQSGGLGSSILGGLFGLGSAAVGKYSDRRLKANVTKLGELDDGLGVYEYDYVWGEHDIGVMADEVAELRPWALGPTVNGFATVNYGAL